MDYLKKNLTQVRSHTYLSNNDPRYCEKYLKFHPHDRQMLYQYAQELFKKGKFTEGVKQLEKSSALGYFQAKRELDHLNQYQSLPYAAQNKKASRYSSLWKWLLAILILSLLLFTFLIVWRYVENRFFIEKNDYYYQFHEYHNPEPPPKDDLNSVSIPIEKQKETLALLSVENAFVRYHELYGHIPKSLDEMTGGAPSNFLTLSDEATAQKDTILLKSKSPDKFANFSKLELHFYPKANKLILAKISPSGKETILSSYTTASGKENLPFSTSKVSQRVVNPNGGDGVLGTRGLVLQDGYAIHGTNDPASIGQKVTHGCIRLRSGDMEALYSYISIGTPFLVKPGLPDAPLLKTGLPQLSVASAILKKEESPGAHFTWRN
ncbi:L,D-transpeptidase [Falsibacillus pallidus]|uniref:L,D-transpeptidase n=1 Tax=Falsibacillus pallidus TaxID=493781 RepID=UPI000E0C908C|nr:L,D-transpeptidase [Falsibacillus pallidus]